MTKTAYSNVVTERHAVAHAVGQQVGTSTLVEFRQAIIAAQFVMDAFIDDLAASEINGFAVASLVP